MPLRFLRVLRGKLRNAQLVYANELGAWYVWLSIEVQGIHRHSEWGEIFNEFACPPFVCQLPHAFFHRRCAIIPEKPRFICVASPFTPVGDDSGVSHGDSFRIGVALELKGMDDSLRGGDSSGGFRDLSIL